MNISTKSVTCPQCEGQATATRYQHLTASGGVGHTIVELHCPNGCRVASDVVGELWGPDLEPTRPTRGAAASSLLDGVHADEVVELKQQLAAAADTIANLEFALGSSRRIGMALGIVMATCRCTDKTAFDLLKTVSQTTNIKLRDVADALVLTGDVSALLSVIE